MPRARALRGACNTKVTDHGVQSDISMASIEWTNGSAKLIGCPNAVRGRVERVVRELDEERNAFHATVRDRISPEFRAVHNEFWELTVWDRSGNCCKIISYVKIVFTREFTFRSETPRTGPAKTGKSAGRRVRFAGSLRKVESHLFNIHPCVQDQLVAEREGMFGAGGALK